MREKIQRLVFLAMIACVFCSCHSTGDDDSGDDSSGADDSGPDDTADDSATDDTMDDDTTPPPSCEGVQVNNGLLNVDNDSDGFTEEMGDCNDADNSINPGAVEVFDGVDNNCDGTIDEGFDNDCDGYQSVETDGNDCNDADWRIHPGAPDNGQELIDFNCDGVVGDATSGDADGDGFARLGTDGVTVVDCDDSDSLSHPGAPDFPEDGIDQDCDGVDLVHSNTTGIFVATTGNDTNPGTMTLPKQTISAGIILAEAAGKSVVVAAGVYSESIDTTVSLFGGYESVGWTRNIAEYVTTINVSDRTAITIASGASVAIQGFTIISGSGPGGTFGVFNSGSTATLMNNIIDGGLGAGYGSASHGVYNSGGTVTLVNNVIHGGSGSSTLGLYNEGTATLVNNVIDGGAAWSGRSVGVSNDGTVTLVNNVINGGSGSDESDGVRNFGIVTLVNNDIWGLNQDCMIYTINDGCTDQLSLVNACGWDGCAEASGNIKADPLFVDPAGGDFHIQYTSPCRDAGIDPVPDYIGPGFVDFDLDGDPRPYGPAWDIGPDEWAP